MGLRASSRYVPRVPTLRPQLRLIGPDDAADQPLLDGLAALLADRHRAHRAAETLLDPRWSDAATTREHLAGLLADPTSSGAVAVSDGQPVAYVLAQAKDAGTWGENVWVESAGIARGEADAELVRDLYAAAAQQWVDAGRTAHYVLVPSHDGVLVDAFFRLGFGLQHVHAIRRPAPAGPLPDGVRVRRAQRADVPVLARLDRELPLHQGRSPVFSSGHLPTEAEALEDWQESFDDERFTTFVAELDGEVVGSAIACDLELSSLHRGPALVGGAGFLGFAAVLPHARGRGAGRALGEAVLGWSATRGDDAVVTDWRATNLQSSRAWTALGFRPTFYRLHRLVGH